MVRTGTKWNFIHMGYKIVRNLLCNPKTFGHIHVSFFTFYDSQIQLWLVPKVLKSPTWKAALSFYGYTATSRLTQLSQIMYPCEISTPVLGFTDSCIVEFQGSTEVVYTSKSIQISKIGNLLILNSFLYYTLLNKVE